MRQSLNLRIEPATPAEAATITSVSQENQRNMRKSGVLPQTQGHARFDIRDLCRLAVIGHCSKRGIGPQASARFVDDIASSVYQHLLYLPQLYDADARVAAEIVWEPYLEKALEATYGEGVDQVDRAVALTGYAMQYLAESVEPNSLRTYSPTNRASDEPPFYVVWADDSVTPEAADFLVGSPDHRKWQGALLVFSTVSLAHQIAKNLSRPMVFLTGDTL